MNGFHVPEGSLDGVPTIDPELLVQELLSGRMLVLVDVRTTPEFRVAHIPGSRSIPIHQLDARSSEIVTDRSTAVVLVSGTGLRAEQAAGALRLGGFPEVATLEGGLARWRQLGFALEEPAAVTRASQG